MDPFSAAGVSLTPLEGGWSGETFLAEAGGERTVVRIYADPRHPEHAAEIAASLLRLVRGLLPVPQVREVRRPDPAAGMPALLVTELLPGERADLLVPALDADGLGRVGAALGEVAAVLAGMPTLRGGMFVDRDLRIEPFDMDLVGWVERHRDDLERMDWHRGEVEDLLRIAERAQARLDTVDRTSLVHSDLNPKNVLLDPGTLAVTGVLDWEFTHSGHPFTDLGNLLRFERAPSYVAGVLSAWESRHGTPADDALDLARAADLVALVDLAARSGSNPVATRAETHLRAIVDQADWHAVPD
ncbi:phosphotransferase family protein [Nocardioides antri]|uniref:Aminoglycoside phosphotransferase family protein n=1 Tax=Nocardioides antri TaxID=2607659 RepID=A0A5B1LZ24_9ACTN|nr:aminoglycoside phosphotransferase family protein [Nocardioides antri]KAA1425841.1 aminoglycoside phosphotransferase family protein [Nocardioides antri]